jgi:hypothetical protein
MPHDKRKGRLRSYLRNDETGIRKELLTILLQEKKFTTDKIYEILKEKKFDITHRGVCAMIGLMNTKLGILGVSLRKSQNIYWVKENCREIILSVLENY